MAETLSPNPTQRQRLRVQSPTSPFFIGSNDDNRERAQARAARAAAIRRKSVAFSAVQPPPQKNSDDCLDKQQILDLFHNCIKLASENKINQKNTWELNLIDHIAEIIKVEEEADVETNFQKASCTLEAGVKIYSLRVDATHSEAYKVLGGINRAGFEDEQDGTVEDANIQNEEKGHSKKDLEIKISPLSTLEPSFEALNAKKFDVAFPVDPLYHQTSAQFDEGGAKGLLLNNLGVYGGCRVLFDSQEVPGKCMLGENQHERSDIIDLSFAQDYIEQMVQNMQEKNEISPTLTQIVNQFNEHNRRLLDTFSSQCQSSDQIEQDGTAHNVEPDIDADAFETRGAWNVDHDDRGSFAEDDSNGMDTSFPSYDEENEPLSFHDPDLDDRFEEVDTYLFLNLGFPSKQNAWAGPDHWKYRKSKVSEDNSAAGEGLPAATKRQKAKKQAEVDIDFTKALDEEIMDIFAPPKNPKSLLVPANRAPCKTILPEDCHYQPEDLVKLFLLPKVLCLGKRRKRSTDGIRQQSDDFGSMSTPSLDDEDGFGGQFDDGNAYSDVEDPDSLVSMPRQVNKVDVNYDKTSKQVDVQALKETLWHQMQGSSQLSVQNQEEAVSFRNLLATFPSDCRAAASEDISPHLCFICLLHLANEHGLSIHGCASLDDLSVHLPRKDSYTMEKV